MKSVQLVCLAIFAALSATTAKHLYESRIINGQDATEGQFPHMVSLRNKLTLAHFCGASILTNRFLLTAAHCCYGDSGNPKKVIAIVGALRISRGGVSVELDTITPHKGFGFESGRNDIGLIRTAEEIIFTVLIQPIALPTVDLSEDRSTQVVLSGWGQSKISPDTEPDVLQFAEFKTISINECVTRFTNVPNLQRMVHEANICTVNKLNISACSGDSGSGLVDVTDPKHKVVVGFASWVYPCAQGYPDVHTKVYSHLDWIRNTIENQSSDL